MTEEYVSTMPLHRAGLTLTLTLTMKYELFSYAPARWGTPSSLEGEQPLPEYLTVHSYSVYKLKLENLRQLRNLCDIKYSSKEIAPLS